jgi:DNA-binding CsgD family transcriptional regulator
VRWDTVWIPASRAAATVPLAAVTPLLLGPATGGDDGALFFRAAGAVMERTQRARLAVLVDDAHLLDPASAALIEWVATQTEATVAMTVRAGEGLPDALDRLRRDTPDQWRRIGPLTRPDFDRLLDEVLGGPADGLTRAYLWRTTGGNPLYLREIITAGLRSGVLAAHEGLWRWRPDTDVAVAWMRLADLVRSRIDALPAPARDALELVACGEPLAVPDLEILVDPPTILDVLERDAFLAVERHGDAVVARLAHPLFGEVLRATLPPFRARSVHRRLATAFAGRQASLDDSELLRLAAWAVAGGVDIPADLSCRAGRMALDGWDLELAEALARLAIAADGGWTATQLLADVLKLARRTDEAAEVLADAVRLAESGRELARSSITAAETLYWGLARPDDATVELGRAGEDPSVTAMTAMLDLFEGRVERAFDRAWHLLGRPGLADDTELWLRSTAAFAAVVTGRTATALTLADEGRELAAASPAATAWSVAQFEWVRGAALADVGRLDEADAETDAGYLESVATGVAERVAAFAYLRGGAARQRGQLAQSAAHLREASALLGENDPFRLTSLCLVELAVTLAMAGDGEEADEALAEAESRRGDVNRMLDPGVALARGWIARAGGDRSAAVAEGYRSADLAAEGGARGLEWPALHAVARFGEAGAVADRLAAVAESVDGQWAYLAARHAAALAAGDGALLDEVAGRYATVGAALLAAEAGQAAAITHRLAGRHGTAAVSAARAARWLETCGNPACPTLPDSLPSLLTLREQEIAELAATGLASRGIAARLDLSVRTVDNHLGRIYRKLGITGRADLARLVGTTSAE